MQPIHLSRSSVDPDSLDSQRIWQWRNDPVTRQMSITTDEVPWERHRAWYAQAARDPRKVLLLASHGSTPLGVVRFDLQGADEAEVSINVNPAQRGQGLSRPLLAAACAWAFEHLALSRITARIKPGNLRSLRIFTGVGFVRCEAQTDLPCFALARDALIPAGDVPHPSPPTETQRRNK